MDYVLILFIGLAGGAPLMAVLAKAGYPFIGVAVWLGILVYAVWCIADVMKVERK